MATSTAISHATSKDGTRIGFERSGKGPPLVLVHGTTADRTRWARILPALEGNFTVYAVDRCGRGLSGDHETYALEREYEDIAAVIDSIGGPVDVVAHSHGALCTVEAALLARNLRRLVLYEPPYSSGGPAYPPGFRERLEAMVASGERDELVATFFREAVGVADAELEMVRSAPSWGARVEAAHTIPRELVHEGYVFDPARFAELKTPVLLLLGGASPQSMRDATEALHRMLPNSRVEEMAGQSHIAMDTAPDLFLRPVIDFLTEEPSKA
jgi:pimeloyl-ACP methyl ester carboxylesterase